MSSLPGMSQTTAVTDDVVIDTLGNPSRAVEGVSGGSALSRDAPPAQGTAPPAPPNTLACPRCGAPQRDGGRFCSSCGMDLVPAPAPAPPVRPDARRPPLLVRLATAALWVVGIPLLIVGGLSFVLANVADDADAKTFAPALSELGGDLTAAKARTAELRAPTDALTEAVGAYAASLEELAAAHSAMVDGVNRSWVELTESGSGAIARNELAPTIRRYREAVADQKAKQAALEDAVSRLQEVTR